MGSETDEHDDSRQADTPWLDRHLGKVIAAGLAVCLLALVGRALTG